MKNPWLLTILYLVATIGLTLLPVSAPKSQILGITGDKWMHVLLFGGLATLLRWHFSTRAWPSILSIIAAVAVALSIEIAQGFLAYRSADIWDLFAGLLGAVGGTVVMKRILSSSRPDQATGIAVGMLGMIVICLSALADLIQVGGHSRFGMAQIAGTILGAAILAGGLTIYRRALEARSRPDSG